MHASFVEIDGVRTRYLHAGSGPPLLLLHGVGMAADSWIENIEPLAAEFSVYAPDMLGCGFTELSAPGDAPPAGPPQLAMVAHLSALIDHLGLERFAIVGSSLGGLIAALQYFAMPDRVRAFAFAGSAAMYAAEPPALRQIFADSFKNGSMAYADISIETLRQRLGNIVFDVACLPEYVLHTQLTSYALPWSLKAYQYRMQGMIAALDAGEDGWIRHRLAEIAVPTLAIAGDGDPRTTPAWEAAAAAGIAKSQRVEFENCGHLPHLEYPDRFNRLITRFVKGEMRVDASPGGEALS
ncbi:MAG: alpha/beta hydrolase [Proteobacteria bacterium]|nr:alpha/beta hydrolase [Pseudomonadota bacterium]